MTTYPLQGERLTKYFEDFATLRNGTPTTAAEWQAKFAEFRRHGEAVQAELNRHTLPTLKNFAPHLMRRNKAQLVASIYTMLEESFLLSGVEGWIPTQKKLEDHIAEQIAQLTDEEIANYQRRIAEKNAAMVKSLSNPEILQEFETFVLYRKGGERVLTDEQLARYDLLRAERHFRERAADIAARARVSQITDVEFEIVKEYHTKRGCDIWIVRPIGFLQGERLERTKYNEIDEKANRYGAHWSSWGPKTLHGFTFFEEEDAIAFLGLTEGEGSVLERWQHRDSQKRERAVERLALVAETRETQSADALATERKTNTVRRAMMAEAAEREAHGERHFADILQAVSEALDGEKLPLLQHLRFAADIETLEYILRRTNGDVRAVAMPTPWVSAHEYDSLSRITERRRGSKRLLRALGDAVDGWFKPQERWQVEALRLLFRMAHWKEDRLDDIERLYRMGIDTLPVLRAALREYLKVRPSNTHQIDPVRQLMLDLVGKQIAGYFPTPSDVVSRVVRLAELADGQRVLEPNGGAAHLLDGVRDYAEDHDLALTLDTCEVNYDLVEILEAKNYAVVGRDFLAYQPESIYDRILMNPPFENLADVDHIRHAYEMLAERGILVAIMSASPFQRNDHKAQEFRAWLKSVNGEAEELPDGSFLESDRSTGVATRLVVIHK